MKKKSFGESIPVCEPLFEGNELKYVTDCVKSGWISSLGAYVPRLEKGFSSFCRARYGISCSSGTAALHLALVACGIGKGDEVIIPDFTMISTAMAVHYTGARPVSVDIEADFFTIDPEQIEAKITWRTKAIIAVHMYGHPADMRAIKRIAKKHKLALIEDAAEAHGAEYRGRKVGSFGDAAAFSFYGNKIVTCGEGGIVLTSNKKIHNRLKDLRDLARKDMHSEVSFNYRLSNLQAAIGCAQMERIEKLINFRRRNARLYAKYLNHLEGVILPREAPGVKRVFWMFGVLLKQSKQRDAAMAFLRRKGIETRPFFTPISKQPLFKISGKRNFPVTDFVSQAGFYLPSGPTLSEKNIKHVAKVLKCVFERGSCTG